MKKILIVAPEISPPLTEGRKLYVSELSHLLSSRGIEIEMVSNSSRQNGLAAILQTLQSLRERCSSPDSIRAIAVFPYGTFHGIRGLVNQWFLMRARSIASKAGIRSIPVFYSCAGMSIQKLNTKFSPALAMGRGTEGLQHIHLGTSREIQPWSPRSNGLKNIVFLCGYQMPTRAALNAVLYERGLYDLLQAAHKLPTPMVRLTIAIPFLRHAKMQRLLLEVTRRTCPALEIQLRNEVDSSTIFSDFDAFAFPYHTEHAVFIPTSLLEALTAGIPTIAADHLMYRSLTQCQNRALCELYQPGDTDGLSQSIIRMAENYQKAVTMAHESAIAVREKWTIQRSTDEIVSALISPP